MKNEVLDFIQRRFKDNCHWLNGNCYYFATILKNRFPKGKIYYDVISGHFIFWYQTQYYDWSGIVNPDGFLVEWNKFDEYDSLQKKKIIEDCIL